jgi:hypothetical protein
MDDFEKNLLNALKVALNFVKDQQEHGCDADYQYDVISEAYDELFEKINNRPR